MSMSDIDAEIQSAIATLIQRGQKVNFTNLKWELPEVDSLHIEGSLEAYQQKAARELPHILADDGRDQSILLNTPYPSYCGDMGQYRLLTAAFGHERVKIYEAVSGTDRYPPGRNMYVEMSFDEIDNFLTAYTRLKASREEKDRLEKEARAARVGQPSSDDFDPFLDSDDLP